MAVNRQSVARQKLIDLFNKENLLRFGAEVGVQEGRFSAEILQSWKGSKLYMVDAWRHLPNYKDVANVSDGLQGIKMMSALENTRSWHERRCIVCDESVCAAAIFPDEYFDWIYLDADHSAEGVKRDLKAWVPKVKKGGIIAGDDYIDGYQYKTDFGVKTAVTEFFKDLEVSVIAEPNEVMQWWIHK